MNVLNVLNKKLEDKHLDQFEVDCVQVAWHLSKKPQTESNVKAGKALLLTFDIKDSELLSIIDKSVRRV